MCFIELEHFKANQIFSCYLSYIFIRFISTYKTQLNNELQHYFFTRFCYIQCSSNLKITCSHLVTWMRKTCSIHFILLPKPKLHARKDKKQYNFIYAPLTIDLKVRENRAWRMGHMIINNISNLFIQWWIRLTYSFVRVIITY